LPSPPTSQAWLALAGMIALNPKKAIFANKCGLFFIDGLLILHTKSLLEEKNFSGLFCRDLSSEKMLKKKPGKLIPYIK
jgi:hypothetical protein